MDVVLWILFILFILFVIVRVISGIFSKVLGLMTGKQSEDPGQGFAKKLHHESAKWVQDEIISEEQKQKIQALYKLKPKIDVASKLPNILIGIACTFLGIGIFHYIAANWQQMPPSLKLAQVYGLVILMYSLSFYFFNKKGYTLLGRAFLILGILSFGAAIALIAQIFHITSSGGTGLLIWILGGLAISWVMKEKWGYYLCSVLAFIWTFQLCFTHHNPNYLFPFIAVLIAWLFYNVRAKAGIVVMLLQCLFWLYQINIVHLRTMGNSNHLIVLALALHVPVGVTLAALGYLLRKNERFSLTTKILNVLGPVLVFLPILVFSIPIEESFFSSLFIFTAKGATLFNVQYLIYCAMALTATYVLYKRQQRYELFLAMLVCGPLLYFLPLGNSIISTLISNVSLFALLYALLYFSHLSPQSDSQEKGLAFGFAAIALLVKGFSSFAMGVESRDFFVAYCMSFILFIVVCFLIGQLVKIKLAEKNKEFDTKWINSASAAACYFFIYVLSMVAFEPAQQKHIFTAHPVIQCTTALFLGLAILLYVGLYKKKAPKMGLAFSGAYLAIALLLLFISGFGVHSGVYFALFNIWLFIIIASLLYLGWLTRSMKIINIGVAAFVLHAVTRYFDLVVNLLHSAPLFIVTGILVLVGAYLLEKRRLLLDIKIDNAEQDADKKDDAEQDTDKKDDVEQDTSKKNDTENTEQDTNKKDDIEQDTDKKEDTE